MKKLAIVYYLTKLSDNLKNSIECFAKSKTKDIELILVNSNMDETVDEFLSTITFENITCKTVNIFENLGHSYAYNIALNLCQAQYVYFANSRIQWNEKVISTIVKGLSVKAHDLYTFMHGTKEISRKNSQKIIFRELALKYFIFNTKFLSDKEQLFVNFHHYHNLFIFQSLIKSKSVGCVDLQIDEMISPRVGYSYNVYDILSSSEMIYDLIGKFDLDGDNKEDALAIVIFAVLHDFLGKMIKVNTSIDALTSSIINANNLVTRICPDYKENKFIQKYKDEEICKYVMNFTPTVKYIKKALK